MTRYELLNNLLERINRGESVNIQTDDGRNALMLASQDSNLEIVKELLKDPKIDVNVLDVFNNTALIWASYKGELEIVKELLKDPKIDISVVDSDGKTALGYAKEKGYKEIESLLMTFNNNKVETFEDMGW